MKKRMTAVAVAVVIAISGGLLYTAKSISDQPKQQASSAQMPIPQVPVAEVITQELNPTAEYTGYYRHHKALKSSPESVVSLIVLVFLRAVMFVRDRYYLKLILHLFRLL
nr:hypothetical protein GPGIFMOB_00466 [Acinetobacter gerneri]